jgi:hypothetical protein
MRLSCAVPGRCRLHRALGRWWPDGNPLRRRADRVEAAVLAVLIAALAVAVPFGALRVGRSVYTEAAAVERAGRAGWHQVTAVLVAGSGHPAPPALAIVQLPARWVDRGIQHRGTVAAVSGSLAGSKVLTWVDASGRQVGPPSPSWQVVAQGWLAGVLTGTCVALLLSAGWILARSGLDRHRLAEWETAWLAAAP